MAGVRRGVFTCVGWQVTLCDPMWQITFRSSEMGFPWRAAISAFTFVVISSLLANSSVEHCRTDDLMPNTFLSLAFLQAVWTLKFKDWRSSSIVLSQVVSWQPTGLPQSAGGLSYFCCYFLLIELHVSYSSLTVCVGRQEGRPTCEINSTTVHKVYF